MIRAPSVICGALLLITFWAAPQVAAAKTRSTSRRVELVAARPPGTDEMQRFEAAVRSALVTKGLGLTSARKEVITPEDVVLAMSASPAEGESIVARVYIDFTAPDHAALFLIDPRRGRIHVRRVMLDHGFDAVARESTLFVIEQSIDAILEGREIGVTPRGVPAQRRLSGGGRSEPAERPNAATKRADSADDKRRPSTARRGRL